MYEPHLEFQFDPKSLPPIWRITSIVLTAVLAGFIVFQALASSGAAA